MPTPGGPRPTHVRPRSVREVLGALGPATAPVLEGPDDVLVHGVTLDSRAVRPGDLYAALPGARAHGAAYAAAAAAAGAAAVLTDPQGREQALVTGLPVVVVARPRAVLGALSAWLYGTPAARLRTLGVTGTNGKTTTTFLLDGAQRAAGLRTGLVGTVETRIGDERVPSTGTTPEAPDLHALLAVMVEAGVEACSMEVSSHAIDQHRVDGLVLDVAAFTNLSRDHLDYHGTMEGYFAAKARLFTPAFARRAVVCVDDDWGRRLVATTPLPVVTAATVRPPEGAAPADWQVVRTGTEGGLPVALVRTPAGGEVLLRVPLPGAFNVANALVALAVLVEAGLDAGAAAAALAVAGAVPGRMERVHGLGAPGEPLAVVDYAHSPDAITAALEALADGGRPRVVVLGAGGNRDREKRPLMGEAAATAADVVLVTDDNPRSEDPAAIRAAVLEGALRAARSSGATVLEVGDRAAAVTEGVARAWGGGVLLVAGKGHEQGQEVAGSVLPFDDRVALRTALTDAALEAGSVPAVQEENAR